jgi:hypothetical protein
MDSQDLISDTDEFTAFKMTIINANRRNMKYPEFHEAFKIVRATTD